MRDEMRKISQVLCAAATVFLAAPALAQETTTDSGLYFSFGGGLSDGQILSNNWSWSYYNAGLGYDVSVDTAVDYELSGIGAIGYTWSTPDSPANFRVEVEGSYRRAEISGLTVTEYDTPIIRTEYTAEGYLESIGVMANGYIDMHLGRTLPYLGAGVGVARISRKDLFVDGVPASNKYVHAGAWQVMSGIGYKLSPGMIVGVEFRYFELMEFEFDDGLATNNIHFNEFLLTLRLVG